MKAVVYGAAGRRDRPGQGGSKPDKFWPASLALVLKAGDATPGNGSPPVSVCARHRLVSGDGLQQLRTTSAAVALLE